MAALCCHGYLFISQAFRPGSGKRDQLIKRLVPAGKQTEERKQDRLGSRCGRESIRQGIWLKRSGQQSGNQCGRESDSPRKAGRKREI